MKLHRIRYKEADGGHFCAWSCDKADAMQTVRKLKEKGASDISVSVVTLVTPTLVTPKQTLVSMLNRYENARKALA